MFHESMQLYPQQTGRLHETSKPVGDRVGVQRLSVGMGEDQVVVVAHSPGHAILSTAWALRCARNASPVSGSSATDRPRLPLVTRAVTAPCPFARCRDTATPSDREVDICPLPAGDLTTS